MNCSRYQLQQYGMPLACRMEIALKELALLDEAAVWLFARPGSVWQSTAGVAMVSSLSFSFAAVVCLWGLFVDVSFSARLVFVKQTLGLMFCSFLREVSPPLCKQHTRESVHLWACYFKGVLES